MNIFFSCVNFFFFFFFPPLLTHHLQAGRRCESSFTTENLALKKKKSIFPLLFQALAGRRKHDRFGSVFVLQDCISSPRVFAVIFLLFEMGGFILFSISVFFFFCLFLCSRIDCMCRAWHSLSSRRPADLTMRMHVAACVRTP